MWCGVENKKKKVVVELIERIIFLICKNGGNIFFVSINGKNNQKTNLHSSKFSWSINFKKKFCQVRIKLEEKTKKLIGKKKKKKKKKKKRHRSSFSF